MTTYDDIGTAVLFALKDLLLAELGTPYADSDVLKLRAVSIGRLQDDPTSEQNLNHVVLDFLPESWNKEDSWAGAKSYMGAKVSVELSGGEIWLWRFGLSARLYVVGETRETMAIRRSGFLLRLSQALRANSTLAGLTNSDNTQALLGASTTIIEKIRMRTVGADNEGFAVIEIQLCYQTDMWMSP